MKQRITQRSRSWRYRTNASRIGPGLSFRHCAVNAINLN